MKQLEKILGAGCFALFIGVLLGLSSAPTVTIVMSVLAGAITVVLGLKVKNAEEIPSPNYLVIGAFGLFGIVGVLAGLEIRTGEVFGNDLKDRNQKWSEVLRDTSLIDAMVIYEETGLLIKADVTKDATSVNDPSKTNVLFSASADVIDKLDPNTFDLIQNLSSAWLDEGPPWSTYAKLIEVKIPIENKKNAYLTIWSLLKE